MKFLIALFSALGLMFLSTVPGLASWVSGNGDDTNDCTFARPCVTFARALAVTTTNGEINCLDAGAGIFNFAQLNINKSVTIDCRGLPLSTQNAGNGEVTIAFDSFAGGDTRKTVRLRGLDLRGLDDGTVGVAITGSATGTTVVIEDCVIDGNFGSAGARGIDDQRTGGGRLIVTNTTIRNNSGAGVSVLPASGSSNIQVLLNNVRSLHNGTGAQFGNLTRVVIDQSTFTANTGAGILTVAGAIVNVDRSTISHNANGVQAAGGVIALANSNITLNTSQGVNVSGGTVFSFGNNRIAFNASPGTAPSPAGSVSNDLGQQ